MSNFKIFSVSKLDELNFNRQIIDFVDNFKKLKEKNPNLSNQELLELMRKINNEFSEQVLDITSVRADTFRYHAMCELLSNRAEFKRIYAEVSAEVDKNPSLLNKPLVFPLDLDKCKRVHIIDAIRAERQGQKEFLEKHNITKEQFNKIDFNKAITSRTKEARANIKILKKMQKPEFDRIEEITRNFNNELPKSIKSNYVSLIKLHYNVLDQLGEISKLIEYNNSKLPEELHITKEYLDSYMTEESLSKLSFPELSALSSFYINKYTKVLRAFETGMFILNENYSIDDLLAAENPSTIIPNLNKKILINQKNILTSYCDDMLAEAYSKKVMSDINIDLTKYNDGKDEFMRLFGLTKDIEYFQKLKNVFDIREKTVGEYKLKDYSMIANLSVILQGKKVENWGLIEDDNNGYDINSDYVLLGFDIKNLNMPLRLHMPSDMFKSFVREHMKTELVPIYEGDKDFVQAFSDRGTFKRLSTFLLYRPTAKGKAYLKSKNEEIQKKDRVYVKDRLISHLYMISDSDAPIADHLKEEVKSKKKANNKGKNKHQKGNYTAPAQNIKKKFYRRFFNIRTKQIENEKDLRIK